MKTLVVHKQLLNTPNAIEQILTEPLNLQEGGEHKYFCRKKKVSAHRIQRQHKLVHNARRVQGSRRLVKGYNTMPKDKAL